MDFIKEAWTNQASEFGTSYEASWKDIYAIQLEIDTIGQFINSGNIVLDVGCANGYSTFSQLKNKPEKIIGIDYVEKMIAFAEEKRVNDFPNENISFKVGDIRNLQFDDDYFDVVYTTRVLINLSNWEEQKRGILGCLRVLKKGGTLILSEAFWEPLVRLNSLRTLAGLPALVEHDFNRYLKKTNLISFLSNHGLDFQNIQFSSLYYLGTRFMRELVEDLNDPLNYQNEVNEMFYGLEKRFSNTKDFGIQQAFIIRK